MIKVLAAIFGQVDLSDFWRKHLTEKEKKRAAKWRPFFLHGF
jgi:hypothetical protein